MSDKLSWEVKPSLSRWKKLFQANKMKQAPEEGKVYKPNSSCSILKKNNADQRRKILRWPKILSSGKKAKREKPKWTKSKMFHNT